MFKLESLRNSKFEIDRSKLGYFVGGGAESTAGGEETLAEGTEHETTIKYSSDTKEGNTTTWHLCSNGQDPNCDNNIA